MGDKPADNPYGLVFTELHSVNLRDMDGDGLKDIVTGKTYWSHHTKSPLWDAGAVVYWFKLVRGEDGVRWVPHQADGESGIGRQLIVEDINRDGLQDIVVGGMKGCHVLIHERREVDEATWQEAQPRPVQPLAAGLTPQQAARRMSVPPGFRVQLAAGEPIVHQPIAMAIDHRGRVWVAEAHTYPRRAPEGKGKDKILILEDTNGDGTLDSRKVFVDGLNLVSGLEVGFGGVWVGAAPYLLFIPDKDGDDRPDGPAQVLLDGFGYQDTHETLNAFIWGPDGWLYGCHEVFTHSRVGKPGTSPAERTPMNAAVWRYQPLRHEFEVFAWGTSNPWGVDFNDHGQAFVTACVIPHLYHAVQGARFQRQAGGHFNPYVYDDIKTIADHAHYAGDIRDHAWWGQEPDIPLSTSQAGGGHAHCGAMVYLGDNWPERYRNQIFFNNVHGNRVNQDLLERRGSGYVGRHGRDFLLAHDKWYRGINLRYGPDGSVYLIDWYDPNACHRTNPEIWDRTNGRIYRISYGQVEPPQVDIRTLADAELVDLQQHRNDWYVRAARRVLQERGGNKTVHAKLREILETQASVPVALRALWALHVTNGLDESYGRELLRSDSEYVRAWTIQLLLEDRQCSTEFCHVLAGLAADDPSQVVRLYLAAAMQRLPLNDRWQIAESLVQHASDASDHNLPLMYWYGIEPLVASDAARAIRLARSSRIALITRFVIRRAAASNQTLGAVASALAESENQDLQRLFLEEMLRSFEGRVDIPAPPAWAEAYERLLDSEHAEIRDQADQVAVLLGDRRVLPRMRQILADTQANPEKRKRALDTIVRGRDKTAAGVLQAVLAEPALRGAAIRALAAYDDPGTAASILAQYARLTEREQRDALGTLVVRPEYAMALLNAIVQQQVPRTHVHAYHIRQLLRFDDRRLNERIEEVWGTVRATTQDKQQLMDRYKRLLTADRLKNADTSNGRQVFNKTCATCHVLFGEGEHIGPDITGSNRANLDYVLETVLDPNAVVGKDYLMTDIVTFDGRVISGLVLKETDSAVTLRTINDTMVIAKQDIDQRLLATQSLMPEQLLETLKPGDVRDLVAYLASPTQVALRGPRAPIDPQTNKVPGALEGESLKIIGKTAGDARSQRMDPFPKDRWSGADHLWWTGAEPTDRLDLELPVATAGRYNLEIVLTKARDYGIVQLSLDDRELGGPIDLFHTPDVMTTGVLSFDDIELTAGAHRLRVQIVGANPKAVKAYMFGLDYARLVDREAAAAVDISGR